MEAKFRKDLEIFRGEAQSGAQSLYAFLTMHANIGDSRKIRDAVNENSLFWKTCLASLQSSFFIIMGRVFDNNSKHNLFALLDYAENHPEMFSLAALEQRKRAASANAGEWIDGYLGGCTCTDSARFRTSAEASYSL